MEQQTEQLQEILPEIQFPSSSTLHTEVEVTPQLRKSIFDDVVPLVKRWQSLQQKINSVDSDLAIEKNNREHQLRDQQQKRTYLDQLDASWIERAVPELPREILKEMLKNKNEELY